MNRNLFAGCQSTAIAAAIEMAFVEAVRESGNEITLNKSTRQRFAHIAAQTTAQDGKAGFLLHGEQPGTGKTTTARAIYKALGNLPEYFYNLESKAVEGDSRLITLANAIDSIDGSFGGYCNYSADRANYVKHLPADKIDKALPLCEKYQARLKEIQELFKIPETPPRPKWYTALELAALAETKGRAALLDATSAEAAPVLFIDDLGVEPAEVKNYGNIVLPLIEVLRTRYEAKAPVVITTNFGSAALTEKYDARIVDRLREMCQWAYFSGESFRK